MSAAANSPYVAALEKGELTTLIHTLVTPTSQDYYYGANTRLLLHRAAFEYCQET